MDAHSERIAKSKALLLTGSHALQGPCAMHNERAANSAGVAWERTRQREPGSVCGRWSSRADAILCPALSTIRRHCGHKPRLPRSATLGSTSMGVAS